MVGRLTPFALWRSRLPAQIGTWFARDLTRSALDLVDGGRVALRSVEPIRIESTVKDRTPVQTTVEWATGTGPQALRSVCTCGASGVCQHVVATLETVRTAEDAPLPAAASDVVELDLSWIPDGELDGSRARARAVWPVLSIGAAGAVAATLYLDTPRLRGVIRDAEAILGMMDQTPADDWDDVDRQLLRDDAVQEAFGTRSSPKALARALFRPHPPPAPALRRRAGREPPPLGARAVRGRAARGALARPPRRQRLRAGARDPRGQPGLARRRGRHRRPAGLARGRPHGLPARRRVRPAPGHRGRQSGQGRAARDAAQRAGHRARRAVPDRRGPGRAGRDRRRAARDGGAGRLARRRAVRPAAIRRRGHRRAGRVQPARRGDRQRRALRALPARGRARLLAALPGGRLRSARGGRLRPARRRPRGRGRAHPVAVVGGRRGPPRRLARRAGRRQPGRRQRHRHRGRGRGLVRPRRDGVRRRRRAR